MRKPINYSRIFNRFNQKLVSLNRKIGYRNCFFCNYQISFSDYFYNYIKEYIFKKDISSYLLQFEINKAKLTQENLLKIYRELLDQWNSEYIQILCCTCIELLKM